MKNQTNRSMGKTDFNIGNACIEVNMYKKAKRDNLPSLKKINNETNNRVRQMRK